MDLGTLLVQADSLRFKLLGIIGNNPARTKKITIFIEVAGMKVEVF